MSIVPGNSQAIPGQISNPYGAFGQAAVRNERLNAVEAGYLQQGLTTDQHTGLQSFATAIGNALGGRGGSGFIPAGIYHMGSGTITYPVGVTCGITGEMPSPAFGTGISGIGGTVLKWDSDVAAAPHTVYGITLGGPGGKPQMLERVTLEGPVIYSSQYGGLVCALAGINARENNQLQDLNIVNFSSGVGFGGTGQSYDHSTPKNLRIGSVGYGFNFLIGSTGSGDFHVYGCSLTGNLAGVGVASSCSSGLDGSSWVGVEFYGPIGIHRYNDQSGNRADFMDSCSLHRCSFELNGVASIFDDLWASGTLGGNIGNSVFDGGVGYGAPTNSEILWQRTFNCSGSGTTLTVTDGSGFMFWPGQTVTGSGIPANTSITAVAGTWPWSTATLTVNNTVTSPTSVTIQMPQLASWVANFITGNEILGKLGGNPSTYPFFLVGGGTGSFANNRVRDWSSALTRAQTGPIMVAGAAATAGCRAWGNTFGTAGDVGCPVLGSSGKSGTVSAGDVLMTTSGQLGTATRCDGTRRPLGIAIRTYTIGNVDYLVRASASNTNGVTIPVNNYTASSIAAGALVKVDTVNPGGVTTAASPNDGWVIGVNGTSVINATSSGNLAELWL